MHTLFKRGLAALTLSAVFSLPALATNPISSPDTMILGDSIFALSIGALGRPRPEAR